MALNASPGEVTRIHLNSTVLDMLNQSRAETSAVEFMGLIVAIGRYQALPPSTSLL
jgi:hypothetical protein